VVIDEGRSAPGLQGASICDYALAYVVWREMSRLGGSHERQAQQREEGLLTRFITSRNVVVNWGPSYLQRLRTRHPEVSFDLGSTLRFHCNEGFSVRKCEEQLQRLRDILGDFDLRTLGEWTWILVQSDDWKPILRRVGRDPDSPAFTILAARETFLEEALFDPDPLRKRTFLERFRMSVEDLLPFAVAHELAHALCREVDERRTERYATQLRQTGRTSCREAHIVTRSGSLNSL